MICSKCRADNPAHKRFCGDCGTALEAPAEPVAVPSEPGVYFCYRHKKVTTRVRCGRCEQPICDRCMVSAPVGIRCRECAKNPIPVRPRAVLYEAGRAVESAASNPCRTVWYLALWTMIVSFFTSFFSDGDL